jgi:mono/diheme cytochrome c family protein
MRIDIRWPVIAVSGPVLAATLSWFLWADRNQQAGLTLDPDDAALVEIGKSVYAQECAVCHGANLEGQPNWRERLPNGRLPAPPHDATGHTWHHPDQQLFDLTNDGPGAMVGAGYESDVPGYDGKLSLQEIVAVLSFIKSTWPANIRRRHDQVNARYRERER